MFKKINYQRDLKNLTKSIIIKLDSIGYQIQHYLYKNKGYSKPDRILDNKREWKYYINLSGKYHSSDTEMYLYNRYTDEDMLLTVENINMYPELRNELMLLGDSFNDLVKKYPYQESLIKSILFPVDIEKAISAENGTILTYNKNLVDRKEYSLIPRLQDYIYGYFARWYIEQYIFVEDLYLTTAIGELYSKLYTEIESIRLSNLFTYEAHDYYIDLFFSSHLDTAEDVNILPENVKMWLYKNLRFIERHTGKNSTLDLIVDKIFSSSGLGIGEINLLKEDVSENLEDTTNLKSTSYFLGDKVFKTNALNNFYIANRNKKYDLSQIIKKELMLSENSSLKYDMVHDSERLKTMTAKYLNEKSKILEFDDRITLRSRTIPEMHVIVDNWFYYAFTGRYNYNVEIKDENTNLVYNINAKQGALMLLKVMLSSVERTDVKLRHYKATAILRHEPGIKSSVNRLFIDRQNSDKLTNLIFDNIPEKRDIINSMEEMREYLLEVNELNNLLWYAICNSGNAVLSATLKHFQDRIYMDKDINLMLYGSVEATIDELLFNNGLATVDELLFSNGLEYKIDNNYNHMSMMKLLIKTFTGLSFNTSNEDTEDMDKLLKLVKKILSYSVQILYTPVSSSSIESPYTGDALLHVTRPMITPTDASFIPLEDFYGEFFSRDYLFKDFYSAKDEPGDVIAQYCPSGFGLNYRVEKEYGVLNQDISMSIDFECLDLYIPGIDVEIKARSDGIIDISSDMPMEIVVLSDREDIALVHFAEKLSPVKEQPSFNMSLDYTDVDLYMGRIVEKNLAATVIGESIEVGPNFLSNIVMEFKERNLATTVIGEFIEAGPILATEILLNIKENTTSGSVLSEFLELKPE